MWKQPRLIKKIPEVQFTKKKKKDSRSPEKKEDQYGLWILVEKRKNWGTNKKNLDKKNLGQNKKGPMYQSSQSNSQEGLIRVEGVSLDNGLKNNEKTKAMEIDCQKQAENEFTKKNPSSHDEFFIEGNERGEDQRR